MLRPIMSLLDGGALREWVGEHYDIGGIDEVALWLPGINDHYRVRAGESTFMLRVYRLEKRTDEDVRYELAVLQHLDRKGVPVAVPITRRDGDLLGHVDAPEGRRQAVLFAFAPGQEDLARRPGEAVAYGAAMARIHEATDDFASEHSRFALDARYFVDRPLATALARLAHRPEDVVLLRTFARRIQAGLAEVDRGGLDRGLCHGDLYGANASKTKAGMLTLYDFDHCGVFWRAYDLAVFRWGAEMDGKADSVWASLLEGYRSVRALSDDDVERVPLFVAVRTLWHLGIQIENGPTWGYGWNAFSEDYLDRRMAFIRRVSETHLEA